MIHQHQCQHGLRDRRRAKTHARVVTPGGDHLDRFAVDIDGLTRQNDAGSGFQREAHDDVLA